MFLRSRRVKPTRSETRASRSSVERQDRKPHWRSLSSHLRSRNERRWSKMTVSNYFEITSVTEIAREMLGPVGSSSLGLGKMAACFIDIGKVESLTERQKR